MERPYTALNASPTERWMTVRLQGVKNLKSSIGATVEMKAGAASGASPTHVEGPFGTLDASGFTTVDKGAAIQFWGPVRVTLNGVSQ